MDNDVYTKIIQDFITLFEEYEWYVWFQEDGATALSVEKIMYVSCQVYTLVEDTRRDFWRDMKDEARLSSPLTRVRFTNMFPRASR